MKAESRKQKAEMLRCTNALAKNISAFCLLLSAFCTREQPANVKHGKELTAQYGCTSCHEIPGVKGPRGMVGPPLDHMAARQTIAGKYANDPDTLAKWLQNPQAMDPQNQMPNLGVTPDDARDIAAFLGTLK